jgi:hypothetical protein
MKGERVVRQSTEDLIGYFRSANHAARTLQFWYSDSRFVDEAGRPRDLPFSGDDVSFSALVRAVGGDIPAGAVRAELLAAGSIVESDSGTLTAVKRYFVPGNINEDVVIGLTQIVHPVIEGLVRNTGPEKSDPFVQRFSYSDRLVPAAVPLFRQVARGRCSDFVQSIDDWLSSNEIGNDDELDHSMRVGVGVFYFEGPAPSEPDGLSPNKS